MKLTILKIVVMTIGTFDLGMLAGLLKAAGL